MTPWQRLARYRRAGILVPVAVICMAGSVAVRLASGTGTALAQGVGSLIPASAEPAAQPAAPAPFCPDDAELSAILERVAARESAVAEAEKAAAARKAELAAAEQRISERLAELKAAEAKLSATMSQTASAAEDDLARLTAVYEAMKSKQAIPLFEAMSPEFAAGFLGRMRPDAAGAIMAGLSPEKGYAVSVILAGRNADVPVPPAPAPAQ